MDKINLAVQLAQLQKRKGRKSNFCVSWGLWTPMSFAETATEEVPLLGRKIPAEGLGQSQTPARKLAAWARATAHGHIVPCPPWV